MKRGRSTLEVKRLTVDDAEACVSVDKSLGDNLLTWDLKSTRKEMKIRQVSGRFTSTTVFFGAFDGEAGQLIGYIAVRTTLKKKMLFEFFIVNVAVHKNHQRAGIAMVLLDKVMEHCAEQKTKFNKYYEAGDDMTNDQVPIVCTCDVRQPFIPRLQREGFQIVEQTKETLNYIPMENARVKTDIHLMKKMI